MWIKKAEINSFGQFQQMEFVFEDNFQVVFGLNEAGKTTLHQFIGGVLFGFPTARGTKKKTFENQAGGTYGGSIILNHHNRDYLVTRLGRTESHLKLVDLQNDQEYANPETQLQAIIAPLNLDLFNAIYSFDQEALLKIFNLRPDSFNDYLRSIATPGAEEWMQVATDLDKKAAMNMGRTKTAKRPLNQALNQLNQLETQYKQRLKLSPNLTELELQIKQSNENLMTLKERQQVQQKQSTKHSNLAAYRPAFQQLKVLQLDLNARPAILPEKIVEQLQTLDTQVQAIETHQPADLNHSQVQIEKAEQGLTQLDQKNLLIQQIQKDLKDDEVQLHMLQSKWQLDVLPRPLNGEQLNAFHQSKKQSDKAINFSEPTTLIGGGLIVFGLLFLLFKQIGGSIGLLLIGLGLIGWQFFGKGQQPNDSMDLTTIDPVYKKLTLDMVDLVQADARQQLVLKTKMATDQEQLHDALQQVDLLERQLAWLGTNVESGQWKTNLTELKVGRQQYQRQQAQLLKMQTKIQSLLNQLGLIDWDAFQKRLLDDRRTNEMLEKERLLNEQLKNVDIKALENLPTDDRQIQDQQILLQEINQQQTKLTKLEYQWQQIKQDDSLAYLNQQLADERTQVFEDLKQYFVDKLLSQWIQLTLNQTIGKRLPKLVETAGEYLNILTNGRYVEIKYTKTLLKAKNKQGELLNLIDLSKGTAEQIYVALRLAFIKQMDQTAKLPLLIDDAFVDFDADRRRNLITILEQFVADGHQVIYFTAHQINQTNVINLSNSEWE
ncbi:AAA family ATPase [Weissella coleopterorum]|uniref:AAA family ATPase n=1 Tax=Weissella coleopterorum TaxID=2714949 RepID=A0A6G8AZR3_9LACO|nr:AAA family ATPase [Weissella coleopterorum]QIL50477.1 AAA family ATPase [Weissella coleopterorum]